MTGDTRTQQDKAAPSGAAPGQMRPQLAGQVVFHLLILGFCVAAFFMTFGFDDVPPPLRRGMLPETFPRMVLGLAGPLIALSLWQDVRKGGGSKPALPPAFWVSLVAIAIFPFVAMQVDILIAMGLFAGVISYAWGCRSPIVIAALGILVPAALFLLFSEGLDIRFPRGLVVNLIYG